MRPNLLLAGVQKSGTTWLHHVLARHPAIWMSRKKELSYFSAPPEKYESGWEEYLSHFSRAQSRHRWRGESTPHYFWVFDDGPFSPRRPFDVATRVAERLGDDVIVLVTLRDPVSRAISGYWHNFAAGRLDLETSLFRLPLHSRGVIDLGFYRRHHQHWAALLGEERLRVQLYDDLVADPAGFVRNTLELIGAPVDRPRFWAQLNLSERRHELRSLAPIKRDYNPVTPAEVAALLELYRDDIRYVEELTGRDLSHWRDLDALIEKHAAPARSSSERGAPAKEPRDEASSEPAGG